MSKTALKIRIGTSGWHYPHWASRFYPADLPKNKWFEFYAQHFNTVEVNNTFYQLPKQQTFQNWYTQAPKDFIYVIKANRFITHIKRLKDPQDSLDRFFQAVSLLKQKLGPILFQLPPNFQKDLNRLADFIAALPKTCQPVFEFRHQTWFSDDTYDLLNDLNAAFCTHDMPGNQSPRIITANMIYIRFHGPTEKYEGNYSSPQLKNWTKWINEHSKNVHAIYAYFNNDYNACAIQNAKQLKQLLNK